MYLYFFQIYVYIYILHIHIYICMYTYILFDALEHEFYFSHSVGNVIIPTDKLHHFWKMFGDEPP